MASRIRTVKPELFRHEGLFEAEQESGLPLRLAFIGLFTVCDREGRFPWKPRALKLDVLPFDSTDFSELLEALHKYRFLFKYEDGGKEYGFIPSWLRHQVINTREAKSVIPPPPDNYMSMHVHAHAHIADTSKLPLGCNIPDGIRETVFARDGHRCVRCKSDEDLTIDHIFPQSMGGSHAITNLRTLCKSCNCARPVQGQGLIDDLAKDGLTLNDMQRMCMHAQVQGEGKGREGEQEGEGESTRRPRGWLALLVELGAEESHASDWLKVRKTKRAAVTDTVLDGIKREAAKAGMTFGQAIQSCAENAWQGFKAEWVNKPQGGGGQFLGKAERIEAANQQVLAELNAREDARMGVTGHLQDSIDDQGFATIEGDFFREN